ncbi:MAG: glycosyltransferase family 2 protein [Lachnospiraceae bacterium]|nr:glycosyltransferase family 2 protein [Lachnospiraceae bacterium]
MPTVSVIIPVYKSMDVLETAVQSVLKQSFEDFELLLIEDGSPDGSLDLCRRLAANDARIRVYHKENGGICSARNYGMSLATGKYIAFLDHDDEYLPGYLSDHIALLENYQADVVKFERVKEKHALDGTVTILHGSRICKMPGMQDGVACYQGEEIAARFPEIREAAKTMYIWDGIYRRDFLRQNHLVFDESFRFGHEDMMLNLEILSAAQAMVFHTGEYYKHKYRESTSTSATFDRARVADSIRVAKRESRLLADWGYPPEQILYSYMNALFVTMNILCLPGADCSRKTKKELLENFRKETVGQMEYLSEAVKKLFRIKKLHGILAWLFMKKQYTICLAAFRVYFRLTNSGTEVSS